MPFPASRETLSLALEEATEAARNMRTFAQRASAQAAAGAVTSSEIFRVEQVLRHVRSRLVRARDTPGIGAYAQAQLGVGGLDIAAEFVAMLAELDATIQWVRDNFPRDATGILLAQTWGPEGPVDRIFAPAATAGLRARLDALAATVS